MVEHVLSLIDGGADPRSLCRRGSVQRHGRGRTARATSPRSKAIDSRPRDLKRNAQGHDVSVRADAVESFLDAHARPRSATVIVDPPRTGMSKEAMAGVVKLQRAARGLRVVRHRHAGARCAGAAGCGLSDRGRCARSTCSRTPRTSRRLFLSRVSGLDEALEQLAELAGAPEILRMPLHRDAERQRPASPSPRPRRPARSR